MDVALKGLHPCKRETVRGAGRGSTRIPSSRKHVKHQKKIRGSSV